MNLDFLLPHIAHVDNVITLLLLIAEIFGSIFSVFFLHVYMIPVCTYTLFIKYFKINSSFFLKLFGEKIFVNSVKVFPLNIISINPIQKYQHITESYACLLKIFILMFLLLINALIYFGICSTPK